MKIIMLVLWGGTFSLHPYETLKHCQEDAWKFYIGAQFIKPEQPYHFQCFDLEKAGKRRLFYGLL